MNKIWINKCRICSDELHYTNDEYFVCFHKPKNFDSIQKGTRPNNICKHCFLKLFEQDVSLEPHYYD